MEGEARRLEAFARDAFSTAGTGKSRPDGIRPGFFVMPAHAGGDQWMDFVETSMGSMPRSLNIFSACLLFVLSHLS